MSGTVCNLCEAIIVNNARCCLFYLCSFEKILIRLPFVKLMVRISLSHIVIIKLLFQLNL